jgi:hypothetical protein
MDEQQQDLPKSSSKKRRSTPPSAQVLAATLITAFLVVACFAYELAWELVNSSASIEVRQHHMTSTSLLAFGLPLAIGVILLVKKAYWICLGIVIGAAIPFVVFAPCIFPR